MQTWACIIKLFTAVFNSVMLKASVIKVNKKLWTITNTLAWYITEFITVVKSFMIQAPEVVFIVWTIQLILVAP